MGQNHPGQDCTHPTSNAMKQSIAIIGSRGIPAKYGGFETFAEHVAPSLVEDGYEVWASCEGTDQPYLSSYKGVRLFYFPIKPFRRVFYETMYDIFSLARASVTCDSVLMLGYGAGLFFFIPKLFRKRLLVNVDGREWKREKYNKLEKAALYVNERFALFYADTIVADARAIKTYLTTRGRSAVFIPYGVDAPRNVPWDPSLLDLQRGSAGDLAKTFSHEYLLIIARLERENNILMMIDAFLRAKTGKKLILVGSFLDSDYQKEIETLITDHQGHDRIAFVGPIYNKDALNMLRQHCFAYLHGHSAGGTNPSLLEAMITQNLICAHDNQFNREVCDRFALFFSDATELCANIQTLEACPTEFDGLRAGAYNRAKTEYSWDRVVQEYEALISDNE